MLPLASHVEYIDSRACPSMSLCTKYKSKVLLAVGDQSRYLIHGKCSTRFHIQNGISSRSLVFAGLTIMTNRASHGQKHTHTDMQITLLCRLCYSAKSVKQLTVMSHTQTHTQTDHGNNRPYLCTLYMRYLYMR